MSRAAGVAVAEALGVAVAASAAFVGLFAVVRTIFWRSA